MNYIKATRSQRQTVPSARTLTPEPGLAEDSILADSSITSSLEADERILQSRADESDSVSSMLDSSRSGTSHETQDREQALKAQDRLFKDHIVSSLKQLRRNGIRRIFGPARIDSNTGSTRTYALTARPGGEKIEDIEYFVSVLARSSTDAKVGLAFEHGPDATLMTSHSTPISLTRLSNPAYAPPCVLAGDTFTKINGQFGDWFRVVLLAGSQNNNQWACVEVWEMRKP